MNTAENKNHFENEKNYLYEIFELLDNLGDGRSEQKMFKKENSKGGEFWKIFLPSPNLRRLFQRRCFYHCLVVWFFLWANSMYPQCYIGRMK